MIFIGLKCFKEYGRCVSVKGVLIKCLHSKKKHITHVGQLKLQNDKSDTM